MKKIIYKILPKSIKNVLNETIFYDLISKNQEERKKLKLTKSQLFLLINFSYIIIKLQIFFDLPTQKSPLDNLKKI